MDFTKLQKDYNILFICKFGSHLYGTDSETSDTDYKGIFLPSPTDCFTNNIPKSLNLNTNKSNEKNSADDIDCEIYSLQYFLELLRRGETVAIDMIHCNEENIIVSSAEFLWLQKRRNSFYTKNMKAFVGYAQKQAAKYGMKGSRISAAKKLQHHLQQFNVNDRLATHWNTLPQDQHLHTIETADGEIRKYTFCGKQLQETIKVGYALDIVNTFLLTYGERARLAEKNEGVDWKAISHAVRAAMQLEEIYSTGDLVFPLQNRHILKQIKQGKISFKTAITLLEVLIEDVTQLAEKSEYPTEISSTYINQLICAMYH